MADFNLKDDLLGFGRSQLKYMLFHNTTLAALTEYSFRKGLFFYDTILDAVDFLKDGVSGWHSLTNIVSPNNPEFNENNTLNDRLVIGDKNYATIKGYNTGTAGFIVVDEVGRPVTQPKITFEDIEPTDYTTVITAPGVNTRFATEKAIVDYLSGYTNYWKKVGTIISPLITNDYLNVRVGTTDAILGNSTSGVGIRGISVSGQGIYGQSTTGAAGYFTSLDNTAIIASIDPASTNTQTSALTILRTTRGTASNGIGASIGFHIETASGGQATECAHFGAVLSNATLVTIQSDFVWRLRNTSVNVVEKMRLSGAGLLTVPSINLSSGTINKYLYLDASKNITYVDAPSGGVTPVDNIFDWDTNAYKPYTSKTASAFYTGITVPDAIATVLNYDGVFRATRLYEGSARVMTTHGNWPANGSLHAVTTTAHAGFCPKLPPFNASTLNHFLRANGVWTSILDMDIVTSFNTRTGNVNLTKADVEDVLTGNIITHWHDLEPLGISTLLDINSSVPIEEFFRPLVYNNKQENQFLIPSTQPDSGGDLITITAYDAGAHTMTLSYFPELDYDDVVTDWLISKSVGAEPGRTGQDQQYAKILSVTRNTDGSADIVWDSTITRNITTWGNGTTVFLLNIKRGWSYNMDKPNFIISNNPGIDSWNKKSVAQGGFFRTSAGNVRLIVNGYNDAPTSPNVQRTIGLAKPVIENDMEGDWELDASPRIDHTNYPAWCSITGFVINSIINHPTIEGYFVGFGSTYDTIRRVGYVVFNEDMSFVEFSPSYIDLGDGGFYQCSVALFEGTYRMFLAELNGAATPDTGEWSLGYYESKNPLSLNSWVRKQDVNTSFYPTIRDIKNCYKSSHTTEASLFTYNGDLYAFADGTSRWNDAGNRGQRSIGLLHWTGKSWVNVPHGPVFVGYQFADIVWGLPYGHTGGIVSTIIENNDIYFVNSLTQSLDDYKIVISKKLRINV